MQWNCRASLNRNTFPISIWYVFQFENLHNARMLFTFCSTELVAHLPMYVHIWKIVFRSMCVSEEYTLRSSYIRRLLLCCRVCTMQSCSHCDKDNIAFEIRFFNAQWWHTNWMLYIHDIAKLSGVRYTSAILYMVARTQDHEKSLHARVCREFHYFFRIQLNRNEWANVDAHTNICDDIIITKRKTSLGYMNVGGNGKCMYIEASCSQLKRHKM